MTPQLQPTQVKGLEKAYEDIKKLSENTRGIKIATWVGAISSLVLAVAAVVTILLAIK